MDPEPADIAFGPNESLLSLMPISGYQFPFSIGLSLLRSDSINNRAQQHIAPNPSTGRQLEKALTSETQYDLGLPLGFSIPFGSVPLPWVRFSRPEEVGIQSWPFTFGWTPPRDQPVPLALGGVEPSKADQLRQAYLGQRTDRGFNLFGFTIALPEWAGGLVRTHQSASLAIDYRNGPPGFRKVLTGGALDFIHPGSTSLIDREIPRAVHDRATGFQAQQSVDSPTGFVPAQTSERGMAAFQSATEGLNVRSTDHGAACIRRFGCRYSTDQYRS